MPIGGAAEIRNHDGCMPLHLAAGMGGENLVAAIILWQYGVRGMRSGSVVQKPPLQYAGQCGVGARNWLGDKDIVPDHMQLIHGSFLLGGHISCMDTQFEPINFTLVVDLGVYENQCRVRV